MIREYGSQYINPHRLMKLCARTILLRLFDQDDLLLHMAYKVFQAGHMTVSSWIISANILTEPFPRCMRS